MNIALIIILIGLAGLIAWALLGGKKAAPASGRRAADRESVSDHTFRRRTSDKEIEEQFPEAPDAPRRRKSDRDSAEAPADHDTPARLPFPADEIIPESSQFRIYRRTLLNSEIYAAKGDMKTAISLCEGVKNRIKDSDVRMKIDANVDYLNHLKQRREDESRRREEAVKAGERDEQTHSFESSQVRITFDGSIPNAINIDQIPDTIHIGLIDPDRAAFAAAPVNALANQLRQEMAHLRQEVTTLRDSGIPDAASPGMTGRSSTSTGPGGPSIPPDGVQDKIQALQEKVGRLDREIAAIPAAGGQPVNQQILTDLAHELRETRQAAALAGAGAAAGSGASAIQSVGALTDEIAELNRTLRDVVPEAGMIAADRPPAATQARFDSRGRADEGLVQTAPPPSTIKPPPGVAAAAAAAAEHEKIVEKTHESAGEDESDFELLSEYGQDKNTGEPTDEEIFAKILGEDKKGVDGSIEILGEKKHDLMEYSMSDKNLANERQADEHFYREVLKSDKRKKRELPILKVSYDFTKLPDDMGLSREKNIIEYAFYKYKPMLEKANEFIKKRKVRDAINYYKVVMTQNIPPEFKAMIRQNLHDLNEYLEKYLTTD